MTPRSPFAWIINRFSYLQIYGLICLLFFLCLLPIGYFWIITHLVNLRLIDEQLGELREEVALTTLFDQIQEHRLLAMRDLSTQKKSLHDLQPLEQEILHSFDEAKTRHRLTGSQRADELAIWQKIDLQSLELKWKRLVNELPQLTPQESNLLHTSLIHELLIQFGNLSDRVGISFFKKVPNYAMVETVLLRLPHLQENLSQLYLLTAWERGQGQKAGEARQLLTQVIAADLAYLQQGIELHLNHFPDQESQQMLHLLGAYERAALHLLGQTAEQVLQPATPLVSLPEPTAIKEGFSVWLQGLADLQGILATERELVFRQLWFVLFLTLLLTGLAFSLGLALTRIGTLRLSQLTEATHSFTNGQLSVRVPELYQDEIGRQAHAFNRMAQKLEEIVKRLYELRDATTRLAGGDLTIRIHVRGEDTEFDQVAQSFNKMAETFEAIMGRLQQIGLVLTQSASEITGTSQEQETIIVQQEHTTREIAVTAKEISATAKTLARTMNDVSQSTEQTSLLAATGKESLNHMEAVMHQMVDASSQIAGRLAILNEKAGNITSVITTITKVADQTNLLSLNASIEAEKAGEYGRSFAVIAREIRRLADQTAASTLDIEKIVTEMMAAVSSSVTGVDDFTREIRKGAEQMRLVSGQLGAIIEQVQAFTRRFEAVNAGMQAQSMGAEQIDQAIAQLSHTAQQTSQAIHQLHKTIQELNQAANELRILNPFKSLFSHAECSGNQCKQLSHPGDSQFENRL